MSNRQVYMHIMDIQPTESFWEVVDDTKLYAEDAHVWTRQHLIDDIRENGIKYALNVDGEGNVKNGNMRYWCARYLFEEENDLRFEFLPVQRNYAAGSFSSLILLELSAKRGEVRASAVDGSFVFRYKVLRKQLKKLLRQKDTQGLKDIIDKVADYLTLDIHKIWANQTRDLTIPHATEFPLTEVDPIDEFRMKHFWEVQRNTWAVVMQPDPRSRQYTICYGLPGMSDAIDTFVKGSEEEQIAFKEYWKKQREERMLRGKISLNRPPKLEIET